MICNNKIINLGKKRLDSFEDVVLCYGHFNLIHPGHLRYLQYARSLGKTLIVAIKSDKGLDLDSFGQHFSEGERAESVANLEIIDHVVVLDEISLSELIENLGPNILALGKEFENQRTKEIELAINAIEKQGRVVFHAGETHYSTVQLLHDNISDIEKSNIINFQNICKSNNVTYDTLQRKIDYFSNLKILVVGDTIVDNYVACDAIGVSAEAPVLVVKELENKEFVGGAAIVASHMRALGAKCHYISVIGEDLSSIVVSKDLKTSGVDMDLIVDSSRPTTYKTRYMVENQKLFRVSKIKEHKISEKIEKKLINRLNAIAPEVDGIMVSDFVYGVITPNVLNEITFLAKKFNLKLFGDLQCSSQMGKVTKFNKFDLITPTEKEARVALDDNESGIEWIANTLLESTSSKNMLIKLGADGFIAYSNKASNNRQNFPALTANPADTTGAGDSLFAAMSVSLASNASLLEASIIGACMASLAVREVGNIPITKEKLSGYIEQLLEKS